MLRPSILTIALVISAACGAVEAQTAEHPLRVGGEVKPPIAIYTPGPQFPEKLLTQHVAPYFMVALVVDQQGLPRKVRMLRGMDSKRDRYALEAIQQYRFKPATLNDQPVAVYLNLEIDIDPF